MEYVLFTMIYLLIFFVKGCLYYKVENRKILACIYVVDIIVTFYKFLLFPLSVFILKFENDFNIFKLLILLICLIVSLLGIYKFYLIIKRIINLTKVKKEINLLLITDILWIIFYNILIFIDSKIY
jgi:hypothetical protein